MRTDIKKQRNKAGVTIPQFKKLNNKLDEEVSPKNRKRKANDTDVQVFNAKKRCHVDITNYSKPVKRKADNDSEAPKKKKRFDVSETPGEGEEVENSSRTFGLSCSVACPTTEGDKEAEEGEADNHIFTNVSPEEEEIYKIASVARTSRAHFRKTYTELLPLGKGGFGSVYEGVRLQDLFPVAIKHIPVEDVIMKQVSCNGKKYNVILEVALMLKVTSIPGESKKSPTVSLLDWYILDNKELILVMEKPECCKDLYKYTKYKKWLDEHEAKMVLKQLVDMAVKMHSNGVFHRDIKAENVLVDFASGKLRVRIIDFGCGNFSTEKPFHYFCGTRAFFPPEYFDSGTYRPCPTTVWQLGALFYSLLKGHNEFSTEDFISGSVQINPALSTDSKRLLNMCLTRKPAERATLEELQCCLSPPQTN